MLLPLQLITWGELVGQIPGGISAGGMIIQIAEHFGYHVVLLEDTPVIGKMKIDMEALIQ